MGGWSGWEGLRVEYFPATKRGLRQYIGNPLSFPGHTDVEYFPATKRGLRLPGELGGGFDPCEDQRSPVEYFPATKRGLRPSFIIPPSEGLRVKVGGILPRY